MSRWALIAMAAAALVCAGAASASPPAPIGGVCGIDPTIDALLGCTAPQSASPKGSSSSTTTLHPGPPVPRVPLRARYLPGVLLVRFKPKATSARADALLRHLHLRIIEQIRALHTATVLVREARRAAISKALRAS